MSDQPPTAGDASSPEENARLLGVLLARFKDAGWLSSYTVSPGTLKIEFTQLGAQRILELHQIFQGELSQLSTREYPMLAFVAGHYGPRLLQER
jgi:hypothetical protein